LRYLGGGGGGCTSENEKPSRLRRIFHHLTFYGFLLCFASTSVATLYHYMFGWKAPYPLLSVPVVLGVLGGIGLLIGPAGLFALMLLRDTQFMGLLLALHLGVVLGLFLTLPYGKFVHGLYRFAALMKYASERRSGTFID
jgi:citrate/tricarballylate utilization protein